jgi:CTP:phosphocholine cytidylyltransferase-like protein
VTVEGVSTIVAQHPKTVYIKRVKGTHHMQLTNSATIVDFFPEAFIAEEDGVIVKRFQKRVYFRANDQKSYSTVTMLTAKNEWAERIANGAEVTNYNVEQMPRSEYLPMAVG